MAAFSPLATPTANSELPELGFGPVCCHTWRRCYGKTHFRASSSTNLPAHRQPCSPAPAQTQPLARRLPVPAAASVSHLGHM